MEESQLSQINGEDGSDEFYEKIEAPKFVDFTLPDQYRPDDRYWFCLRVGSCRNDFTFFLFLDHSDMKLIHTHTHT